MENKKGECRSGNALTNVTTTDVRRRPASFASARSDPTKSVFGALVFVFVGAAQQPLHCALLGSTAPLLEPSCGGALYLFRRPRLPRTEVANAAGKQHSKRLGERHGI